MIISQGKTKVILPGPRKNTVFLETRNVLTGGDAARRETIAGIGIHKTTQAANIFSLLNRKGLPTAFIERTSPNTLLCYQCEMLPLELVVRRYAWGSYLQRHPEYGNQEGTAYRFDEPVWEIFHKLSVVGFPVTDKPYQIDEEAAREQFLHNGIWQEGVYTDPYIQVDKNQWLLYPSKKELSKSKPILSMKPACSQEELDYIVQAIMLPTFLALEDAWRKIMTTYGPMELVDLKIEVGRRLDNNRIVIADVIDNDSWRIWSGGNPEKQLDKQCFRDGNPLDQVAENYATLAGMTEEL
ncbi:Phosphoribosylaminoimidazole-succinocarboxamide synthase [Methanosarcina barkeri str. Wiesmoor]|uniref:phosphoribosylaminoimidazolesuccinocarboxamide synthase n=2 Tax=Methanosarcina barkeri TaxID=2208 RepID=A0A0E3QIT0_METBA|nr:phosphoribosylaminoimidazolesuccinocarboxamide synthase [Methanosarcina barkeri]AKB50695.1 Phosphoribosylaminoimidazole-succinocarboxamide synthase [Methanosarcina barkeri str. Wiesmoor]